MLTNIAMNNHKYEPTFINSNDIFIYDNKSPKNSGNPKMIEITVVL